MSRTPRRGRVRLQSYIEPPMGQRLEAFCAAQGLTEGAVVQAALGQYFDGTCDATLVLRRHVRPVSAGERDLVEEARHATVGVPTLSKRLQVLDQCILLGRRQSRAVLVPAVEVPR